MGVAVALPPDALETADLETAQPHAPSTGDLGVHAGEAQAGGGRAQELDRGMDSASGQPPGGRVGDARQVGELQALEH